MGTNNKDHLALSPSPGESDADCLRFEEKLNEWIDQCWLEQDHLLDSTLDAASEQKVLSRDGDQVIFYDAHAHHCSKCRKLQTDYVSMFTSTESPLLRDLPKVSTAQREQRPRLRDWYRNQSRSGGNRLNVNGVSHHGNDLHSNKFGWSTALVILFLLLGLPPQLDTSSVDVSNHSPVLFGGTVFEKNVGLSSQVSNLRLPDLSDLSDLSVLSDGRWLNTLVPKIDLATVDLMQLNPQLDQVAHYWKRASRLPGIEPWQHSVNFAIGWLNQPQPQPQPQTGQRSASDTQSSQLERPDFGHGATYCVNAHHFRAHHFRAHHFRARHCRFVQV